VTAVLAVDFGATSVRVCRVELDDAAPRVEVVHRLAHAPVADSDGALRWDWPCLVAAMEQGLVAGMARGPVASIGVDTWGVDYGLLDHRGELVAAPYSYRDSRTDSFRDVVDRVGEARLFEAAGLQLQPFNTIFQVAAHRRDELARARQLLLLPELLVHHLTGAVLAERTSAGTTGLVDIATGAWSNELCDATTLDRSLLPDIVSATTRAGTWQGVPVHLVGGHDTASAVVAMGAGSGPGTAFVASGTWLLVGREQDTPDTSERARLANFTNEAGALGGFRHLRNVAGFWLLERCREQWGAPPLLELLREAESVEMPVPTVDAADDRFLHPSDMVHEITDAAGLPPDAPRGVVVRCILESLAVTTARVLDQLGGVSDVRVFGGGVQVPAFVNRLAEVAGVSVEAGPVEAAALGNALVQGIALDVYEDLAHARRTLELIRS
jgi:rhamnulokinase